MSPCGQESRSWSCDWWPRWRTEYSFGEQKKKLYVRHLLFRLCNHWPFDPCVSHVRLRARRTSIYAPALAVCWCHEAAYRRKSETGSPWPFVWVNKTSRAHSSGFDRQRHKYSWLCDGKRNKNSTPNNHEHRLNCCFSALSAKDSGVEGVRLGSRLFNLPPDREVSRFNQSNKSERQHGLRSSNPERW